MTHDELRDYIDRFDAAGMVNEPAVKALRAVVELHKPQPTTISTDLKCAECSGLDWADYPCRTIQAIEEELK